jgi:hypothetical protein
MRLRAGNRRGAAALAAALVGVGSLTLTACGDDEPGTVQQRQVDGSDDVGEDAGLAPEEAAGGAGESRGTGGEAE